jgi:hypothetical protein
MIRHLVLAGLISMAMPAVAMAADSGSAAPGQSGGAAAPGQNTGTGTTTDTGTTDTGTTDTGTTDTGTTDTGAGTTDAGTADTGATDTGTTAAGSITSQIYNGFTVDEALALMQDAGFRAKLLVDSNGFPYIESGAGGLIFEVNFYGCDGAEPERCLQLQFRASFTTDDTQKDKALQYNVDKVFGRVYNLDESTYIEHPMHTNGGVTGDFFVNNLLLWDNVLGEFAEYIDW